MTKTDLIRKVMRDYGEPIRARDLAELAGIPRDRLSSYTGPMIRRGEMHRPSYGVYALGDKRTLSEATGIEIRREVRPVNAGTVRPVELRPQNGEDRTIPLLLEVVARAPDPKPYAGIVQEIGLLLSA